MRGYVDHSSLVGGPVGYLGILPQWDNVFKNTIYTVQSIVGDSVAVRISLFDHPLPRKVHTGLSLLGAMESQFFRGVYTSAYGFRQCRY